MYVKERYLIITNWCFFLSSTLKEMKFLTFETFFLIVQPRSCRILVPRPGIEPLGNEIAEP